MALFFSNSRPCLFPLYKGLVMKQEEEQALIFGRGKGSGKDRLGQTLLCLCASLLCGRQTDCLSPTGFSICGEAGLRSGRKGRIPLCLTASQVCVCGDRITGMACRASPYAKERKNHASTYSDATYTAYSTKRKTSLLYEKK